MAVASTTTTLWRFDAGHRGRPPHQIYNRINQTQFDIVNAAEAINRLQPNTTNLNRLREDQKLKEHFNIDRNGWCEVKLQ